jgi:hypothetical protein
MTITAAAALIGLAAAFGPAGTASAGSLPDGTPVIEVGGRHSGGYRSDRRGGGRDYGHRGGRNYGHRGGRNYGHRGGRDYGHRGYARGYGHGRHKHGHGHDNYGPFIFGGIALGTYLFLDTLDHY